MVNALYNSCAVVYSFPVKQREELPMSTPPILAGDTFGRWTVLARSVVKKDRKETWLCRCNCGNERDVIGRTLAKGTSTSCGCGVGEAAGERTRIDLAGHTFGSWTALSYVGLNHRNQPTWRCRCACGKEKGVVGQSLRNGTSKSCGCMKGAAIAKAKTTHGHAGSSRRARPDMVGNKYASKHGHTKSAGGRVVSRTYRIWGAMHGRCNGSKASSKYYVPYGIVVCERWAKFENFLADMGEAPEGKSLDRYPNNKGNYEPGNCRWATAQEQTDNRRTKGQVVRFAPDAELIEELELRGYTVSAAAREAAD